MINEDQDITLDENYEDVPYIDDVQLIQLPQKDSFLIPNGTPIIYKNKSNPPTVAKQMH